MAKRRNNKRIKEAQRLRELFPIRSAIERAFPDQVEREIYINALIEDLS